MRIVLSALLLLMLTACASSRGFDRGGMRSQISGQNQVTEEEIGKVLDLKPQLALPFRLAIYFAPPSSGGRWNWVGEDKDLLLGIGAELKKKGVVSEVMVINDALVEGVDNKAIRMAAARAGADAVLVVNGASDIDRYNNFLAYSYFLLITPFFIPGTEADGLFMVNASMWDVRNRFLYLSSESEGTAKEIKPVVYIDERGIITAAKTTALKALQAELVTRLAGFGAK